MHLSIDPASDQPVYQQIIDRVKRDIARGALARGDKLPTVRDLAVQLVINPNTIAKAYRLLEQEGIIVTKPGAGAFIAQLDSALSLAVRKKILLAQLERLVVNAVHMQIPKETLADWFHATLDKYQFA